MKDKFNDKKELQVKSKERVKDFGEVFTSPKEVKAMLEFLFTFSICLLYHGTFI